MRYPFSALFKGLHHGVLRPHCFIRLNGQMYPPGVAVEPVGIGFGMALYAVQGADLEVEAVDDGVFELQGYYASGMSGAGRVQAFPAMM